MVIEILIVGIISTVANIVLVPLETNIIQYYQGIGILNPAIELNEIALWMWMYVLEILAYIIYKAISYYKGDC